MGVMEFTQVTPSAAVFIAMSENNIIKIFIRYRRNHQVYYGKQIYFSVGYKNLYL